MAKSNKVPDFNKIAEKLIKNSSRYAASESVKFFKESFVKGGFTDISFEAWVKNKNPLAGKKTMYNKGNLMQSIRKVSATTEKIIIESQMPYSEIHNEGGTITVTEQMKKFFWSKYYEFSQKTSRTKKGEQRKTQSNRKLNSKAEFCKAMALMKVGSKIKIPKRQFMGHSQTMMLQFDEFLRMESEKLFKEHLNDK